MLKSSMPSTPAASRSGLMRIRRACPSPNTSLTTLITTGCAQPPPIQPSISPSPVTTALAPGLAEVGEVARTTVTSANGVPRAFSWAALSIIASVSVIAPLLHLLSAPSLFSHAVAIAGHDVHNPRTRVITRRLQRRHCNAHGRGHLCARIRALPRLLQPHHARRQCRQACEVVRRCIHVDQGQGRGHASCERLVTCAAEKRVQPDYFARAPLDVCELFGQQRRCAGVEAVAHHDHHRAAAKQSEAMLHNDSLQSLPETE